MKLPCQSIVWNVLPAIRAAIAEELIALGVSQLEAARLLEMTPRQSPSTAPVNGVTGSSLRGMREAR